jgi:hypothetical protein
MGNKIITFTDLNAWKEGHKLVLLIYKITDGFPIKEKYALTDQMRRAAVMRQTIVVHKLITGLIKGVKLFSHKTWFIIHNSHNESSFGSRLYKGIWSP